MGIKFDWDQSRRQGIVSGDCFEEIREHFSVKNDAAKFARMRGRYIPSRKYVITPGGRCDVGLFDEINKFLLDRQLQPEVHITKPFSDNASPKLENIPIPELNLQLRDYQQSIVSECINKGRGVVVLATAGGKTLTIATLLESYYKSIDKTFTCELIVPDRGLVEQTVNDFQQYGTSFRVSKWTGDDDLDLSANVIVCNLGILQSSKSNTE